jgi:hypothetical protein
MDANLPDLRSSQNVSACISFIIFSLIPTACADYFGLFVVVDNDVIAKIVAEGYVVAAVKTELHSFKVHEDFP